jgi:hypothetical protein
MTEQTTNEMSDFDFLLTIRNATEKDLALIALYAASTNAWVVKDAIMALRKRMAEEPPQVHPDAIPTPVADEVRLENWGQKSQILTKPAEWFSVKTDLLDGRTVLDAQLNNVVAIKKLRERTGVALKVAKDYVEEVLEDLNNGKTGP